METMAEIFKGISEPTRLRILGLLNMGELCVCDLMAVLDMPQSTVSRHLAYLKKTGWILSRRKGKWIYYRWSDRPDTMQQDIFDLLSDRFAGNEQFVTDRNALAIRLREKKSRDCD